MESLIIARYNGTGNLYEVLSRECKMKDPETREWLPAVIYKTYKLLENGEYKEPDKKEVYIRALREFNEKFDLVLNF